MTNSITKPQKCLYIRNGIEIWMDEEKAQNVENDLLGNLTGDFIRVEGRIQNIKEIVGVYFPEDLEDLKRRKNGEWQCRSGQWHKRNQECECSGVEAERRYNEEINQKQREMQNNPPLKKSTLIKLRQQRKELEKKLKIK